jgi:serine/threonine protein kinase
VHPCRKQRAVAPTTIMEQGQSHEVHADPRHSVDDRCQLVGDGSIAANGAAIRDRMPRDPAADGLGTNDPEPVPQRHASVGGMRPADQVDATMNHRLVLEEQVDSMIDVKQHLEGVMDAAFKDLPPPQPEPKLDPSDVMLDETKVLGRGMQCVVYAGTLYGRMQVAVKVLRLWEEDALKSFENEMRRTTRARHRNIVHVFGVVMLDACTVGVVMERLGASLEEANVTDPSIRMKYTLDIIAGMEHTHKPDHCAARYGPRPGNILLTQDGGSVKIIDFVARTNSDFDVVDDVYLASIGATMRFLAPELFAEEWESSTACDVFAFAVVVAELWTGTVAWAGTPENEIPDLVVAGRRPFSPDDLSVKGVPGPIIALIVACWAQEPRSRPTFAQLVRWPSTPA